MKAIHTLHLHVLPDATLHTMRRHLLRASLVNARSRRKADSVELRVASGEITESIFAIDTELLARTEGGTL